MLVACAYVQSGGAMKLWWQYHTTHSNPAFVVRYLPEQTRAEMRELRKHKAMRDEPLLYGGDKDAAAKASKLESGEISSPTTPPAATAAPTSP